MLTRDALKSYLLEMPSGHVFDLTYGQFEDVFPPGEPDTEARQALRAFAEECACELINNIAEYRYELKRL